MPLRSIHSQSEAKMKIIVITMALTLFALSGGTARAEEPELKTGVYIQEGSVPLEVDRHSSPEVVDWNNDGKKDLIVGQCGYGYIRLYLNQGTDLNPVFNVWSCIEANGSPITASYG